MFVFFLSLQIFCQDRNFKFGVEVRNDKLYCGIANGHSPICSSLYLFPLLSPDFSSKISPQPFRIEASNLVYRFTTTSYNVGLKMNLFLFVLPCVFLSLYIFLLRYQLYALEALKRGYSQIF